MKALEDRLDTAVDKAVEKLRGQMMPTQKAADRLNKGCSSGSEGNGKSTTGPKREGETAGLTRRCNWN